MANSKLKCKQCKDYHPREQIKACPSGFCSDPCFAESNLARMEAKWERAKAKVKRDKKAEDKAYRAETRRRKDEFNSDNVPYQHKLTQKVFNRMRVLQELKWFRDRGLEPECISCGGHLGDDQWCCGHFKTVGAQGVLRYDPMNTRLQHNFNCNMNLSGDISGTKNTRGYKVGLVERFGTLEGERIIEYCETITDVKRWTGQELKDMRAEFSKTIRELEREL